MYNQITMRLVMAEAMDAGQIINFCKLTPATSAAMLRNLAYYAASKFSWEEEIP